jgi:hypothetical protein
MYDLIVGGFLPGTNIQISFQAWIVLFLLVAIAAGFGLTKYKRIDLARHTGLHATQLHERLHWA